MNAKERSIILPITFGSMFEWYEYFLFIYWAPIISKQLFDLSLTIIDFIYAVILLSVSFIARPLGGLIFGYIGDKFGRRLSFMSSIIVITIPSLGIVFMPSFSTWAYSTVIYIGVMRFIQGVPAGGELPGALCLLAEGTPEHDKRKRYLCSYLFVGPQIGQLLSMTQSLLLQQYLSTDQLLNWGWRLSFFISSLVGLLGFFLRRKLHESDDFENLKKEHRIEPHPVRESFKHHKKDMALGFFISIFEVLGFYMIYFYIFQNSKTVLNIDPSKKVLVYAIFLVALTIMMPIIGKIGEKANNRILFKISAIGVMILSLPFYYVVYYSAIFWIYIFLILIILLYCIQFALLPSLLADLFPTSVRFTCLGFSFNIADAIIGGVVTFLLSFLINTTGNPAIYILLLPLSAVIFLLSLKYVKTGMVEI